jgi:hypothetical protein
MTPLDRTTALAGFPAPWTRPGTPTTTARSVQYVVTPGYAEALGLRLKKGRWFQESDLTRAPRPWIVNDEFARLYLPPDPIGFTWTRPAPPAGPGGTNEIVGVIANVLKGGNDKPPQPEHFLVPHAPARFFGHVALAVRAVGDPAPLAAALRTAVRDAAADAAVETVPLTDRVAESVAQQRFATTIIGSFAALALALASIGLYGVLSYSVRQRRRELGVRAALGATRLDLVRLVVREGLTATVAGITVGLIAAVALTRMMQGLLFGVGPLDAVSFALAPVVLVPVALAASLLPALRAAVTNPADALRCN